MPVNPNDTIVGIPKSKIRKIFRFNLGIGVNGTRIFGEEFLQHEFGVSEAKATEIIRELQQMGYLSQKPDADNYYSITEKGKQFGFEKANPPISIEKADEFYAGFLERIKTVNEDPDFIVRVTAFCLFGDYVTGDKPVTHLEILLITEQKDPATFEERSDLKMSAYPGYLGIDQRYSLPWTEVSAFLKERSRYLTIYLHWQAKDLDLSGAKIFDADGNIMEENRSPKKRSQRSDKNKPRKAKAPDEFVGRLAFNERKGRTSKNQIVRKFTEKAQELENIHGQILDGLTTLLRSQHPDCVISPECMIMGLGSRIDVVRKAKEGKIFFYEIKTYPKAVISIRMALGQLLEYAFYPERNLSEEFFIVSHVPATKTDLVYLNHIGGKIGIKIWYIHYNCSTNKIEDNIQL